MLFLGCGIVAAVSCSIIGLSYLGLGFKFRQGNKELPKASTMSKTIPIMQHVGDESAEEAELQESVPQEEPVTILVPELEEEQENK